jgi:hypothetical protein
VNKFEREQQSEGACDRLNKAQMNTDDLPKETGAAVSLEKSRWVRPAVAFAVDVFAVLLHAFGLIGPLLPSHGLPSLSVVLIFVGGPSALIFVASRLCRSRAIRMVCYIQIASVICLYAYVYWDLAQIIGRGTATDG